MLIRELNEDFMFDHVSEQLLESHHTHTSKRSQSRLTAPLGFNSEFTFFKNGQQTSLNMRNSESRPL
jgi:hypothetical protein